MAKLSSTRVYGSMIVDNDLNVFGKIKGNGSEITSIDAAKITTGTIPIARIPYATPTTRGAIRVEVTGNTLYLWTQD